MRMRFGLVGAALAAAAMLPAGASAQYWGGQPGYGYGYTQIDHRDGGRRGYDDERRYRGDGYGYPADYGRGYGYDRAYRGGRNRYRCDQGTGGTIIGAIAGGLLGNSVAGRGDRGVGTIVGAGVGALAGRAVDRDC